MARALTALVLSRFMNQKFVIFGDGYRERPQRPNRHAPEGSYLEAGRNVGRFQFQVLPPFLDELSIVVPYMLIYRR